MLYEVITEPRTDFQAFITIKPRKKHPAVHIDNQKHMKTATGKFWAVRITEARVTNSYNFYNVCYTKLLRTFLEHLGAWIVRLHPLKPAISGDHHIDIFMDHKIFFVIGELRPFSDHSSKPLVSIGP